MGWNTLWPNARIQVNPSCKTITKGLAELGARSSGRNARGGASDGARRALCPILQAHPDKLRYILDPVEVYGEEFPDEMFRVIETWDQLEQLS